MRSRIVFEDKDNAETPYKASEETQIEPRKEMKLVCLRLLWFDDVESRPSGREGSRLYP